VESTLADLRLPVERPALDLATALLEDPISVPSPNDRNMQSSLLFLPLDGATVVSRRGKIKSFYDGKWGVVKKGDTIRYGEVLFVPEGTRLEFASGDQIFMTTKAGMEDPPPLLGLGHIHHGGHQTSEIPPDECDTSEPGNSAFGKEQGAGHGKGGVDKTADPKCQSLGFQHWRYTKRVWIIVANGPQATTGPHPGTDPRIPIGGPHVPPQDPPPLQGTRPVWALYGEAGNWYRRP
jgi:hypothetical protein